MLTPGFLTLMFASSQSSGVPGIVSVSTQAVFLRPSLKYSVTTAVIVNLASAPFFSSVIVWFQTLFEILPALADLNFTPAGALSSTLTFFRSTLPVFLTTSS